MSDIKNFLPGELRAERLNLAGQLLQEQGYQDEALTRYQAAIALCPHKWQSYYNIGLIHKYRNEWEPSFSFNKIAYELDDQQVPTRWNYAIAATALRDWKTARRLWQEQGINLDDGDGPIMHNFGQTPVRLNPWGSSEVVWARRIDPVRARIENIPFPASGYRCGDIVLHDGAVEGYRMLGENQYPVFNVLELFEASALSTFELIIDMPDQTSLDALSQKFSEADISMEDWNDSVRVLCQACNEGTPHEHHDHDDRQEWIRERKIGIGAHSLSQIDALLQNECGKQAGEYQLTCVLAA